MPSVDPSLHDRFFLLQRIRPIVNHSKAAEVFRIKAQQVWDPRARYDVTDDVSGDAERTIDRRVVLAVGMDALQAR